MSKSSKLGTSAFTLIELLAVCVITAVLVGLALSGLQRARVTANRAACMSNQRQIGAAMLLYAADHDGLLPPSTHTTGRRRIDESWIYELSSYLGELDKVRVCPAESPERQQQILSRKASSYVINDLVFDTEEYNRLQRISNPAGTILLFIRSEDRAPSATGDHIHGEDWSSWQSVLSDIEPDRHRLGSRSKDRLQGDANYLFADGHIETISAAKLKEQIEAGANPARVSE